MRLADMLRLGLIFAIALLVVIVFWPSAQVYGHEWQDFTNITFTHGWLVLAVSVALLVCSRREIAAAPVRPSWPALVGLAGAVFAWLVCYRASVQDLHITILPAIFWLAVTAAFGVPVGRLIGFPVAYLYFAVPSLAQLAHPLQSLTVGAMRVLFLLTGPVVKITGDIIEIPNGAFRIEEGCSGLHFMIVGLAVAALNGELRRDPWRIRVAQLALMACLALIANWLRVYGVIEAGYLTDMRSHLVTGHYWFGWGIFALTLIPFFWLTARWGGPGEEAPPARPVPTAETIPVAGLAAATIVLIGLPVLSAVLRAKQPAAPLRTAVVARAPWTPVATDGQSAWQPIFPGADEARLTAYQDSTGDVVEAYRVAYRAQRQRGKLVGMGTSVEGDELELDSQGIVATSVGAYREAQAFDRSDARSLIWYRYQMANRDFVKPLLGQLWYGLLATVSNPPADLVAFRAPCNAGGACADARRVLAEFAAHASVP